MKKLLILALAWLMPAIVFAGVVTQQQAIAEATSFANGRNLTTNVKLASKADRTRTVDATAYYYVFNFGNNQGFVIVSGDDRTNPILGYSDEGSFDADKIPANMKAWLDGYAEQIKALETMSDTEANRMMACFDTNAQLHCANDYYQVGPGNSLLERMSAVHDFRQRGRRI